MLRRPPRHSPRSAVPTPSRTRRPSAGHCLLAAIGGTGGGDNLSERDPVECTSGERTLPMPAGSGAGAPATGNGRKPQVRRLARPYRVTTVRNRMPVSRHTAPHRATYRDSVDFRRSKRHTPGNFPAAIEYQIDCPMASGHFFGHSTSQHVDPVIMSHREPSGSRTSDTPPHRCARYSLQAVSLARGPGRLVIERVGGKAG